MHGYNFWQVIRDFYVKKISNFFKLYTTPCNYTDRSEHLTLTFCFLFYFSNNSKRLQWIEEHFKQNIFTWHCSLTTDILRFIELKNFLNIIPPKKQRYIWPWPWEIGLNLHKGSKVSILAFANFHVKSAKFHYDPNCILFFLAGTILHKYYCSMRSKKKGCQNM